MTCMILFFLKWISESSCQKVVKVHGYTCVDMVITLGSFSIPVCYLKQSIAKRAVQCSDILNRHDWIDAFALKTSDIIHATRKEDFDELRPNPMYPSNSLSLSLFSHSPTLLSFSFFFFSFLLRLRSSFYSAQWAAALSAITLFSACSLWSARQLARQYARFTICSLCFRSLLSSIPMSNKYWVTIIVLS